MTQTHTTIRPAVRADAAAIAEMANELDRLEGQPADRYSAQRVAELAFDAAPLFSVLVADCNGGLDGYVTFQDIFNPETLGPGVWLHDLFVRESARRQGIGQDLFAAVARETLARGGASLSWNVLSANRGARAFYAELGARDGTAGYLELELDGEALTGLAQTAGE
jgi:GNAT superfamily N-acetyltransferase